MNRVATAAAAAVCTLGLAVPTASADTITEIVAASGPGFDNNKRDYDILLEAVLTAGLAGDLADPDAEFTVFAPNDRAFIRLAKDLGFTGSGEEDAWLYLVDQLTALGGGDPIPLLTAVLGYLASRRWPQLGGRLLASLTAKRAGAAVTLV